MLRVQPWLGSRPHSACSAAAKGVGEYTLAARLTRGTPPGIYQGTRKGRR